MAVGSPALYIKFCFLYANATVRVETTGTNGEGRFIEDVLDDEGE